MTVTATELKANLGKYLELSKTQDILITKNGHVISRLSNPHRDRLDDVESLIGIIPADVTLEDAREERASRI